MLQCTYAQSEYLAWNWRSSVNIIICFIKATRKAYNSDSGEEDAFAPPLVRTPDSHVVVIQNATSQGQVGVVQAGVRF